MDGMGIASGALEPANCALICHGVNTCNGIGSRLANNSMPPSFIGKGSERAAENSPGLGFAP